MGIYKIYYGKGRPMCLSDWRNYMFKKLLSLLLILVLTFSLIGCAAIQIVEEPNVDVNEPILQEDPIAEDGVFTKLE